MLKRTVSAIMLTLILTNALSLAFNIQPVEASGTIYIRADGAIDPSTAPIQRDGDLYTLTGNTTSNVVIERNNMTLDGASYTVQGSGGGWTRGIDLTGRKNVTTKNMKIGLFGTGIYLDDSSNNSIVRNNITAVYHGILLSVSSNNTISENTFADSGLYVLASYGNVIEMNIVNGKPLVYLEGLSDYVVGDAGQVVLVNCNNMRVENLNLSYSSLGLELWGTNNSKITNNKVTANNAYGIMLGVSSNCSIVGNNITNNQYGIFLDTSSNNNTISENNISHNYWGIELSHLSSYNNISKNSITTNNAVGIELQAGANHNSIVGNNITNNQYGVKLSSVSSCNSISGNNITNNAWGICLDGDSSCNSISGNNITASTEYGIVVSYSSDNSIIGNYIKNNSPGIDLSHSSYNSIVGNNITDNSNGIYLYESSNNKFYHNNFMDNTQQVYIGTSGYSNFGDDGYPSGGNYWSDYVGSDAYSGIYQNETGSDGMGDAPYVIDANNRDSYPLMGPYVPFENQTIYIRADGSVDPSGAPIWRQGDFYTLTNNVTSATDGIAIERDNMTLDGAGHTLQGTGAMFSRGISLSGGGNVTIKNMEIKGFWEGISLVFSSNYNSISGNNITNNQYSIRLYSSSINTISGNNITNNSGYGILLAYSSGNSIYGNNITNNADGIWLLSSSNNVVYHNNFVDNAQQVLFYPLPSYPNVWDDGYPSGGNYWSDYNGTDFYCGPYQNETGSDGIGDTTYTIDSNNVDNYPLMRPYAQFDNQTIYIRADGSVDPSGAPIQRQGDLYTLTGNITSSSNGIVIERDSIVIDGAGYTVTGSRSGYGITLTSRSNVRVGNVTTEDFAVGILLTSSSNNVLYGNDATKNEVGIYLTSSSNNVLSSNNATNNSFGIWLWTSSNNTLSGNSIACSVAIDSVGVWLTSSSDNVLSGNDVANNWAGIILNLLDSPSNNNSFFHNNFANNIIQVRYIVSPLNTWDAGYPSGGNYWSDYSGTDLHRGTYQNETGSDGIGDTPYVIDENNTDHYPLMNPWTIQPDVAIMNVSPFKTVVGLGYSSNISVTTANQGDYPEAFNVTVYANGIQIDVQPVTLGNGTFTTMTFMWNTTGFAYGDCTINAYAEPVLNETNVINNNLTCVIPVHVGVPGDISGPMQGVYDGTTNMRDIQYLILLFNTNPASPNWKPNADINNDATVNMRDIQIAILNFNKHE